MPAITITAIKDDDKSKNEIETIVKSGNVSDIGKMVDFTTEDKVRYTCPIIGYRNDNHSLYSYLLSVKIDADIDLTTFSKRNIIPSFGNGIYLPFLNNATVGLEFCKEINEKVDYDFYCLMRTMKENDETDQILLLEVFAFSFLIFSLRNRFYTFKKYDPITQTYSNRKSLLYICSIDENFDDTISLIRSLSEYSTIEEINFSNITFQEDEIPNETSINEA